MTQTTTTAEDFSMPVIRISFVLDEWVPDVPYRVSHSDFGLYMSFSNMEDAFTYARSVALMMDLDLEIVA